MKKDINPGLICMEGCVSVVWIVQFILLAVYRFSHTGLVCSGDYASALYIASNIPKTKSGVQDKFSNYYMREEGDFMYYYVFACIALFFVFFMFACCTGSLLFFIGSTTALKFVEDALQNAHKIPDMMSGQAGGPGGPQRPGPNSNPGGA